MPNKTINQLNTAGANFVAEEFIPVEDETFGVNGKISRLNSLPFVAFQYPANYISNNPPIATGANSIAIGKNGAAAAATDSFQIGIGTNSLPGTIQFTTNNFADTNTINFKSIIGIPTDIVPEGSIEIDVDATVVYGRISGSWENIAKKENFINYNPVNYTSLPIGYIQGSAAIGGNVSLSTSIRGLEHLGIGSNISVTTQPSAGEYVSLLGSNLSTTSSHSLLIGQNSSVTGSNYQVTIGFNNALTNISANNICLGYNSAVSGGGNVVIGKNLSSGTIFNRVFIGTNVTCSQQETVAIGTSAASSGQRATAIGKNAVASGQESFAIGANSTASGLRASTFGADSAATATDSVSLGKLSNPAGIGSVTIGTNAVASSLAADSVQFGNGTCAVPETVQFKNRVIAGSHGFVAQIVPPGLTALDGQVYVTSGQICIKASGTLYCASLS